VDDRPYPEPNWDKLRIREKSATPAYGIIKPKIPPEVVICDYENQSIEAPAIVIA